VRDTNTYFCNIKASFSLLNTVLDTAHGRGPDGLHLCTPRRVAHPALKRLVLRWTWKRSELFVMGDIVDVVDADTREGRERMMDRAARPWEVLSEKSNGSVLTFNGVRLIDSTPELAKLKRIQCFAYIST
jgi:hypothetical protein